VLVMQEFYADNPLKKADNPNDKSPVSGVEDLERTRLRRQHNGTEGDGESRGREGSRSLSPNARTHAEGSADQEDQDTEMHDYVDSERDHEGKPSKMIGEKGDDDAKLKIAANDPSMHTAINGLTNRSLPNGGMGDNKQKRRANELEEGEETPIKKMRPESGDADESEEGEVEE